MPVVRGVDRVLIAEIDAARPADPRATGRLGDVVHVGHQHRSAGAGGVHAGALAEGELQFLEWGTGEECRKGQDQGTCPARPIRGGVGCWSGWPNLAPDPLGGLDTIPAPPPQWPMPGHSWLSPETGSWDQTWRLMRAS